VPDELDQRLRGLTERCLSNRPRMEGGFYLAQIDRFAGFAYPTRLVPPAEEEPDTAPLKGSKHKGPKGKGPKGKGPKHKGPKHKAPPKGPTPPGAPLQREPPPLEAPYIRVQARECLTLPLGEPAPVQVRNVEASRVAVVTEPVGADRPARLATWVMVRLTDPAEQLRRYQAAGTLALGGIVLALVLTANLGRTLRRERQAQAALREELRRSEHLATLGKMLAGVAHEVRNPLAGIRSTVQLWQRLPAQARTPESLAAVLQAVDRLEGLVNRLLYFARAGQEAPGRVDLNAVVAATLELLRAQAHAQGVAYDVRLQDGLPAVAGSAQALQQVVLNLATNALQVMPAGGKLTCTTSQRPGEERVVLCLADTGPGVGPEARAHLFEPFYTTRPDGTGLGLALCREIVLQHGGTIELESAGPGAAFRVTLPVARES
jgi:signal transduction histidine kinase